MIEQRKSKIHSILKDNDLVLITVDKDDFHNQIYISRSIFDIMKYNIKDEIISYYYGTFLVGINKLESKIAYILPNLEGNLINEEPPDLPLNII